MDLGILYAFGRVVVGAAFLLTGIRILLNLPIVSGLLAVKRVPSPSLVAGAGAVFEVVMGLAAIAGLWFSAVAIALACFVVVATLMVHDFWNQDGAQRAGDINAVLSNIIIVGALLALAGTPR